MLSNILSVAAVTALAGLANAAPVDSCTVATGSYWVSSAQAHACELNVPYSSSRASSIISSSIKAMQYYSTETWFLQSTNGKIPHHYNVRQALTDIQTKVNTTGYPTDWDFNIAVTDAINREHDGHTGYSAGCTTAFSYNLPVSVVTLGDSPTSSSSSPYLLVNYDFPNQGRPKLEAYYLSLGIDVRPYNGMKLITIDNNPNAQNYLVNLADLSLVANGLNGAYESLSARFVRLTARYSADTTNGAYTFEVGRFGMRGFYPGQDSIKLGVQAANGTQYTITLPWSAHFSNGNSYTTAQLQTNICFAAGVTSKRDIAIPDAVERFERQAVISPDGTEEQRDVAAQIAAAAAVPTNYVTPNLTSFGIKVTTVDIYQLKQHPKVGVIYMEQFVPSDGTTAGQYFNGMSQALYTGITQLKAAGVQHILVDQSGNRGGYIYAGAIAMWSFFPQDLYPGFPAVYRDLDLSRRESDRAAATNDSKSEYFYGKYRDLNYKYFTSNAQFMDPPVQQTINGVQDAFSKPFFDDFGDSSAAVTNFTTPPFATTDIVFIGNGLCASTCSIFTTYLYQKHGIRSVAFGGNPVAVRWSVDGGIKGSEVTSYSVILSELQRAGLSADPNAPQPLPVQATFNLNYRNAITYLDPGDGILEYFYQDATEHFQFTEATYNNPQATWEFVAEQMFGQD